MAALNPAKLHVKVLDPPPSQDLSRVCYTLTHSDLTGELFLSMGAEYDNSALSGLLQRFMRDEVLAAWNEEGGRPILKVHCHVSGGLILGSAAWRLSIFRQHMRQVLEAFRFGDSDRFERSPELDEALVEIHFHSSSPQYDVIEMWETLGTYRLEA